MNVGASFVNRERELEQVGISVDTLQNEQAFLPKSVVEFYGVQGIGKTALLQQIKIMCDTRNLFCIMTDSTQFRPDTLNAVESTLAKNEPVVVILDALDASSPEQLAEIEATLKGFVNDAKVLVVLASRNIQRFDNTHTIARKLTPSLLKPLEREDCFSYLNRRDEALTPEVQASIFEWTRGYPLAMSVMTDTILNDGLDPTKRSDQGKLISVLIQEVIEKKLLASVTAPSELLRLQTLLALLSIPRRFNLILMQDLIEYAAGQYRLESSLAYITLPPMINQVTNVLNWSMERAGYCIDMAVRNLFLLQYRIEQPQRYAEINRFLAAKNKDFAQQVTGSDHIRYLREFFYHLAYSEEKSNVQLILAESIEQLALEQPQSESVSLQSLSNFLQFYEEFPQDDELKEALGQQITNFALSLMRKTFLKFCWRLPSAKRGEYLRDFFSHTAHKEKTENFALIFEDGMRQIMQEETAGDAIKLFNELMDSEEIKTLLGENFSEVESHILAELIEED